MARILVLDDDSQARTMLRKLLELEGYEVDDAPDGSQGVKLFRENPADLIITDMLMPEMPGSRVISQLRNEFPDLKVIAISGGGVLYGPSGYLSLAKELGAQYTFEKPLRSKELLEAVKEILQQKKPVPHSE